MSPSGKFRGKFSRGGRCYVSPDRFLDWVDGLHFLPLCPLWPTSFLTGRHAYGSIFRRHSRLGPRGHVRRPGETQSNAAVSCFDTCLRIIEACESCLARSHYQAWLLKNSCTGKNSYVPPISYSRIRSKKGTPRDHAP